MKVKVVTYEELPSRRDDLIKDAMYDAIAHCSELYDACHREGVLVFMQSHGRPFKDGDMDTVDGEKYWEGYNKEWNRLLGLLIAMV